jgi:hypothetical protein
MPHTDAKVACELILRYIPDIPAWPQLPRRSLYENMYIQFSEGFPGVKFEAEQILINNKDGFDAALEQLHINYLERKSGHYAISEIYASGLHAFLSMKFRRPKAVKGQLIGPISWGLSVMDRQNRPIIYDEILADAVTKHLELKAAWLKQSLNRISSNTILFLDEPYLSSIGTPFVSLSSHRVEEILTSVLSGISGIKGIHCCGNTEWPLLLRVPIDILSFDTYSYADSFSTYTSEVRLFLERGGAIAWGIIPNDEEILMKETISSLSDRLEEAMAPFTRDGIRFRQLIEQGLLTPSCGMALLSIEATEQALGMLSELSERLRKRYI